MAGNRALGSQMETLISNLGGSPAEHPVRSKYATAEQMDRLIATMGEGGIAEAVSDWIEDHPEAVTTVEDGSITEAKLHEDVAAKIGVASVAGKSGEVSLDAGDMEFNSSDTYAANTVGAEIASINGTVAEISSFAHSLTDYLYKENTYINANGVETTLNGYNLYKIPIEHTGDLVFIKQVSGDSNFWNQLNSLYVCHGLTDQGTYLRMSPDATTDFHFASAERSILCFTKSGYTHVMICAYSEYADRVRVYVNDHNDTVLHGENLITKNGFPIKRDENTAFYSHGYLYANASPAKLLSPFFTISFPVKKGDTIEVSALAIDGAVYYGVFFTQEFSGSQINTAKYTCTLDGFVTLFNNEESPVEILHYPADPIMIDANQIINSPEKAFSGLTGVAFGTSLTYRAQTTYGYLQYLPDLSGITFDNQGIGSSYILSNMLTAIKGYSGYSGKRVCILEGFVNDWYYANALGTYPDTTEETVCGCVRSAINYILSQNADITVFLVLDHYGKKVNSVDCRSIATNSSDQTQYEYYEEIAKVAESLGVPVVKLYAESQISENTPQYLSDNIHPTALGAKQTANIIWGKMRSLAPNEVS